MRKILFVLMFIAISMLAFGQYAVGDIVDDYSWTDSDGNAQTLHGLTEQGKAVIMFWGEDW